MSNVVIYTKQNCPWCDRAKDWFTSHNISYKSYEVGRDLTGDELKAMAPPGEITTVPQIFIEGVRIGGYSDLIATENEVLNTLGRT